MSAYSHKLLVVLVLASVSAVVTGNVQCQVLQEAANAEATRCKLDDFVADNIRGSAKILTVGSACSVRDEAYAFSSATAPGINVSSSRLQNDLTSPFCIGILAEIASSNAGPIMSFTDGASQNVGGITLTSTELSITVREASATFRLSATGERYFQLCSDGKQLQLYEECTLLNTSSFEEVSLQPTDQIGLYKDLTNVLSNSFLSSVTQLYFLSCTGPDVVTQDVVDLQCEANPIDCDANATALSQIVESFERRVKKANSNLTTTICSPLKPSTTSTLLKVTSSVSFSALDEERDEEEEGQELFVAGVALLVVGGVLVIASILLIVITVIITHRKRSHTTKDFALQDKK